MVAIACDMSISTSVTPKGPLKTIQYGNSHTQITIYIHTCGRSQPGKDETLNIEKFHTTALNAAVRHSLIHPTILARNLAKLESVAA